MPMLCFSISILGHLFSICSCLIKHPHHSPDSFKNEDANNAYIDHHKNAMIIMERGVDIESLENTFILEVFVRTYVFHMLGTFVTILCNWLIF